MHLVPVSGAVLGVLRRRGCEKPNGRVSRTQALPQPADLDRTLTTPISVDTPRSVFIFSKIPCPDAVEAVGAVEGEGEAKREGLQLVWTPCPKLSTPACWAHLPENA